MIVPVSRACDTAARVCRVTSEATDCVRPGFVYTVEQHAAQISSERLRCITYAAVRCSKP